MTETLVIDASVAVKWLVAEDGSAGAVRLRARFAFTAPELILAECANILWKKATRHEVTPDEARLAIRLMERAGIDIRSMRGLGETATALALDLGHPAYDCLYLALALKQNLRFVTADRRLLARIADRAQPELAVLCLSLDDAAR